MNNLSKNIMLFIIFIFGAGIILNIINIIYLPKTPIFYSKTSHNIHFNMINLENLFFNKHNYLKTINITPTKKKKILTLKNIKLRAIYEDGPNGFIVIEDNGSQFINLNEIYKGYKLTKITQTQAIFTKNHKNYVLKLFNTKNTKNLQVVKSSTIPNQHYTQSTPSNIRITKKTFLSYKTNLSKIWQNIGIDKVKNGYTITYIKRNSIFDKMGLKIGDIIIAVNDYVLKNDNEAWNLYKNASQFNSFQVVIKRNNKTKVINYEIQ